MSNRPKTIHDEFDAFIVEFGGRLVSHLIPTKSPDFDNADYLFESEGVVAEFKFIRTEREDDPKIRRKVECKISEWLNSGKLSGLHYGDRLMSDELPRDLQWELAKIHAKPICRKLAQANKQIKLTKEYLKRPSAKGLLFLANEADHSMPPEHLVYAVHQSLINGDFSSINHVTILTANLVVLSSEVSSKLRPWIDYHRDNDDPVDSRFLQRMREEWSHYLSRLLREPLPMLPDSIPINLSSLRYEKIKARP